MVDEVDRLVLYNWILKLKLGMVGGKNLYYLENVLDYY